MEGTIFLPFRGLFSWRGAFSEFYVMFGKLIEIVTPTKVITRREHLPWTSKIPPLRDVVIAMWFLSISDEHQNVPPVNHQQKCLIKGGVCGTFDIKSN